MQYRRKQPSTGITQGPKGVVSFFVLFLAVGFLLYNLLANVVWAFGDSGELGLRSLAAAIFPLMVSAYFAFIARPRMPVRDSRAPLINDFILFLLWTVMITGIDRSVGQIGFPVVELLYSLVLAFLLWRYSYLRSLKALIAACYGIVTGALASVIVFGGIGI